MRTHFLRDLIIWKKSILLVREIYLLINDLPSDEKFGLISQIRRCAVSIPFTIAEGAGTNNKMELVHFLRIANGSCYGLETQ